MFVFFLKVLLVNLMFVLCPSVFLFLLQSFFFFFKNLFDIFSFGLCWYTIHITYCGCHYFWLIIGIVGFKYIKSVQVAENVIIPPDAPGCNCKGKCTNAAKCYCAQLNGDDFPYVNQDGGRWDFYCWFDVNEINVNYG
jgi:hypothetical protein